MEEIEALKDEIASVKDQLEWAEEEADDLRDEVKALKDKLAEGPEWGNCRRGCDSAYLNNAGYCSPGCQLGGKESG